MAITSIEMIQDNGAYESLFLAVHNPLAFIVEANYTGTAPDELYVSENVNNKIYSCIPYSDPQAGKRQFIFFADEILRGLMDSFDDVIQSDSSIRFESNLTKDVTLRFYDPTTPATYLDSIFTCVHASRQFGESPVVYFPNTETIYGIVGFPCYGYFLDYGNAIINCVES